jgi:hypothetical protein
MMDVCNHISRKVDPANGYLFFNSHTYIKFSSASDLNYSGYSVAFHNELLKLGFDFSEPLDKKLFFPINELNFHWFAVVVDPDVKTIYRFVTFALPHSCSLNS